jgi:putative sterol carrier protein
VAGTRQTTRTATTPTAEFFDRLAARGHEPLLEKATGTVRFDVTDGKRFERWLVSIHKGDIAVSRRNLRADCVIRADKKLFDSIVTGKENATAALLRGAVGVEGDVGLLVLMQRLFPGPPKSRRRPHTAGYARRQA